MESEKPPFFNVFRLPAGMAWKRSRVRIPYAPLYFEACKSEKIAEIQAFLMLSED